MLSFSFFQNSILSIPNDNGVRYWKLNCQIQHGLENRTWKRRSSLESIVIYTRRGVAVFNLPLHHHESLLMSSHTSQTGDYRKATEESSLGTLNHLKGARVCACVTPTHVCFAAAGSYRERWWRWESHSPGDLRDEGSQFWRLVGPGEGPAHVAGCVPHVGSHAAGPPLLVVGQGLQDQGHHWGNGNSGALGMLADESFVISQWT